MKLTKMVLFVAFIEIPAVRGVSSTGWQDTLKSIGNMSGQQSGSNSLSTSDIGLGLKEALSVGTERVVGSDKQFQWEFENLHPVAGHSA